MERATPGHPEGTGTNAITCDCGQRVGVVNGKVSEHQVQGTRRSRCEASGTDVSHLFTD